MEIELLEQRQEAKNIISYVFTRPAGFQFEAGDFVEFAFNYPKGGGDKRWLTIASTPDENFLLFTMKYPPKPSQFKYELQQIGKGHKAYVSPAIGQFNLPRRNQKKIIFIAGGVGITPFRSMLLDPAAQEHDITLLYTAPDQEFAFMSELDASSANVRYIQPTKQRIDLAYLQQQFSGLENHILYLSGPEKMMLILANELYQIMPQKCIKLDYFPGYTEL